MKEAAVGAADTESGGARRGFGAGARGEGGLTRREERHSGPQSAWKWWTGPWPPPMSSVSDSAMAAVT